MYPLLMISFSLSTVTLNRCMPFDIVSAATSTVYGIASYQLSTLEAACDNAGDFFQAVGSDLNTAWKHMVYLILIAIGEAHRI